MPLYSLKRPWIWASGAIAFFVFAPMAVIFSSIFQGPSPVWSHLAETVLPEVTVNTLWLVAGVGAATVILGVSLAWLTTCCDFPGRSWLDWGLMLPMAMPTYVLGFVWIGILDYSGTLPTWLRTHFDFNPAWMPPIRSRGGVIFVMSFAFYPYVYLLARNAFRTQGRSMMEAAISLGMKGRDLFFKISLPMAKPWILAGLLLVLMETLADFGTVSVFNYATFTTAIYKAWFSMFSITAASQLASLLVLSVLVLLMIEYLFRGRRNYALSVQKSRRRVKLRGGTAWMGFFYPSVVLLIGFMIPLIQLILWNSHGIYKNLNTAYWSYFFHTLTLSVLAAILIAFVSLVLGYTRRLYRESWVQTLIKFSTVGYAIPGTVLAVGVFSSLVYCEKFMNDVAQTALGLSLGRMLTGTLVAMQLAYLVRFLAVGFQPIDSALQRVTVHVEEAARAMGYRGFQLLGKIHIPMIRGGFFTALLLVFVDVMKEMPITLMTRPFGHDTLAVKIFELTSEGEWRRAATPSLMLVLIGLTAVIFLAKREERGFESSEAAP